MPCRVCAELSKLWTYSAAASRTCSRLGPRNVFRDLEKVGVISGANTSTKEGEGGIANVKGLDGTIIESKIKLDYDKGLFW